MWQRKFLNMNHHYNLFIRVIPKLVPLIIIVFFLQGCFCKDCVSSVSQQTPDSRSIDSYTGSDQKSETETIAGTQEESTAQTIGSSLQVLGERSQTVLAEDVAVTRSDIFNEHILTMKAIVENESNAYPIRPIKQERRHIHTEKINSGKLAFGKSCPLGIRSITSHIIAGPNMSFKGSKEGNDVYGNNGHKHQPGAGFQVGMGSSFAFTGKFSVNPSLLLKHNSASEKITYRSTEPGGGNYGSESKDKYNYTYLSAPVVASYKVGKQVEVFAGPEINYLLNASVKNDSRTAGDKKENITKNSVKLGVGVQAGVKYRIPSGNGDSPFGVQLLYEHRLSRLNKKNSDGYSTYDAPGWNIKGFQLGVTCSICSLMKAKN